MFPPGLEARIRERIADSLVALWAMEQVRSHRDAQASDQGSFEEIVFTSTTLERLLEQGNPEVLPHLFQLLKPERFGPLTEMMVERWPGWNGRTAGCAAPVIATNSPDSALSLFEIWWRTAGKRLDPDRIHGVADALCALAPRGRAFAELLVGRLAPAASDSSTGQLQEEAFRLAWSHRLPAWRDMLRPLLCSGDADGLVHLLSGLVSFTFLEFVQDGDEQGAAVGFQSLPWLFLAGAPLGRIDELLRAPKSAGTEDLRSLASECQPRGDGGLLFGIVALICELDWPRTGPPQGTVQLILALCLEALAVRRIQTDGLGLEELLDRVTLDVPCHPCIPDLARAIAFFPRVEAVPAIREALRKHIDSAAAAHLAEMMGHLRWPELAPILIGLTDGASGDLTCEAAARALEGLGPAAECPILDGWLMFDGSQRIYLGDVACRIGGEAFVDHLVALFPQMRGQQLELWCGWAERVPHPKLLETLAPEVRRKHASVDHAFATLAALLGVEPPELCAVRGRLEQVEKRRQELREHGIFGRHSPGGPTLELQLECPECGDANFYEVRKVLLDPDSQGEAPFILDELTCLSCGRESDLRPHAMGHVALTAEVLKMATASKLGLSRQSPVEVVRLGVEGGRQMGPRRAIAYYEELVEREPLSPVAWLGLGNCYGNLNRPRRAAECHRRCLELDPACVEASVRLGEYLREQGSRQEAYTVYRDAWRRRHRWVYHRLGRLRAPDIERDVLEALEKLRREVAPKDPPFAAVGPRPSPGKIGRNDPCPCNSGNKFKKCCGR